MNFRVIAIAFFLSLPCFAFGQENGGEAERTLGEIIDDATITTKIKGALIADEEIKALRINVDTLNGNVKLTGAAETTEQISRAGEIAEEVKGVQSVDNRITLGKEDSPPAVTVRTHIENGKEPKAAAATGRTTGDVIDDAWINAKVKAALMQDKQIPGLAIDVDTTNNVVTLSGQLDSHRRAEKAVELAKQVKGVKAVNDQLQVAGEGASGRVGTAGKAPSTGDVSKK
ncbi:MAG: BON domain-containing protein [Burkholderiales bacterium]